LAEDPLAFFFAGGLTQHESRFRLPPKVLPELDRSFFAFFFLAEAIAALAMWFVLFLSGGKRPQRFLVAPFSFYYSYRIEGSLL